MAVEVLEEIGIDSSHHTSESVEEVVERIGVDISGTEAENKYSGVPLDIVITVCDDAKENCPFVPAREGNVHVGFDDPSAVEGTEEEKRAAFRRIRDELADWIDTAFAEPAAE